jgi:phenylalanyl-tRNA synthetase beta chain
MKVSLNHIRYYAEQYEWPDPAPEGIDKLVEQIGAQLGAVEEVQAIGKKYAGILVGRVVQCVQHPNADRLHVCKIDDGGKATAVPRDENGYVQVVCGAPNVREELLVAWLPPGTTVPNTADTDPFILDAREIRGQVSNGMLASLKELALGDDHSGIVEIDEEVAPGTAFAEVFGLANDYIVDIENKMFTHRPDCFGLLGVAREIVGIQHQKFTSPEWYTTDAAVPEASEDLLPIEFKNELPELVPRFLLASMSDVTVKPSPLWLQINLARLGLRSINNIVDLTNYYMILTGQPLHAYDYDKVKAQDPDAKHATIKVRNPLDSERLTLLNGKTIDPRQEAIMIATATKSIGLGGVMGGADTEVDANTRNIILECASFDMYSIRRTSMAHGIFSDAVTRFNKGQSPLQNRAVLSRIVGDVERLTGAKVASKLVDDNHLAQSIVERRSLCPPVPVTAEFINARLGLKLSAAEMKTLLENVEFTIQLDGDQLSVTAPFWRTDIETREDVVEEVGRLYGYDHLPIELPKRTIVPARKNEMLELKARVRGILSSSGANEVLGYSFVHGDLLTKVGQNPEHAYELSNALSPDLQYYRLSLTPSLLEKVHMNIKAGYDKFVIYEIGKIHDQRRTDTEGLPEELEMLAAVYAATPKTYTGGAAFYEARKYLDDLARRCKLQFEYTPITEEEDEPVARPFDYKRTARIHIVGTDIMLGRIGEYKQSVARELKLPKYCAGFGIDLGKLLGATRQAPQTYNSQPRFPKVTQDISLKVPAELNYQTVYNFLSSELASKQPEHSLPTLSPLDIYQPADDSTHKHLTFRLAIASYVKTMTDIEVNTLLESIASAAHEKFGAERL